MRTRVSVLAGALLLTALTAFPQTNPTGTISGKVVDQQGLAIPGVNVAVQSPALQGARSTTTSTNGDYIVPFLPPGEYTVAFELTGFSSVKLNVRVAVGQSIPLNANMAVTSVSETVTVVGQATGDFGQTASMATSFKQDLIEKLPLNRTFQAAALLTPGTQASGPNGSITISGAASFENLFMINGVVVQDNIRNTPFNLFIEDALQETTTSTAAISAEFGRFAGGVVNAVTKSGGNQFSGSFRTTFDNDDWIALTPYPNDKRIDKVIPTYEATVGGPIVKDRLWFFGAARFRDFQEGKSTFTSNLDYTRGLNEKRYEGKLTWALNANNTFKGAYSKIATTETNSVFGTVLDTASLYDRELPQKLISLNYTGIISPRFFVEAQYSKRDFTFIGSGSQFTDLVKGTLLLDQSRGNARYNSPTFCGVCDDERRNNNNIIAKASYFLSTSSAGSHNLVGGFDLFDDKRFANNHQSGSDYRVFTTSAIVQGANVFPVLDSRTFIRWTPIFQSSAGNRFRTYSLFANDAWTVNKRLSLNLGVRYDKNDGKDSLGNSVVKDSAISPRVALTVDPQGDGKWTVNASYGKYVAAIANAVGDSASAGGQPATIDFDYLGPSVNTGNPANPVGADSALNTLFGWFNGNGGTNRTTRGAPSIPGVTSRIDGTLSSPNVMEGTLGFSRRLGTKGTVRIDGVYRKFTDFYSQKLDLSTGRVSDQFGRQFDLTLIQNTDDVTRHYKGINVQLSYRPTSKLGLGGNYTLSRSYGTFPGETGASGPISASIGANPEYFDRAWGTRTANGGGGPEGDLATDVRHKARVWATWTVPVPSVLGTFDLGALQFYNSGSPYGAVGLIDTRPYVTVPSPGYVNAPASVEYFFTARDAFRTAELWRTDLSLNWARKLGSSRAQIFFRGVLLNTFDRQGLTNYTFADCGTGGCIDTTVLTNRNNASIARFNPFNSTPVEGTNWQKGTAFGQPTSRFAYQTPRTYGFSVGLRF